MNAKARSVVRSADGREGENAAFRPVCGDWCPEVRGRAYVPSARPTFIRQLTRLCDVLSTVVEPITRDFRHCAIACGEIIISALSPNARC